MENEDRGNPTPHNDFNLNFNLFEEFSEMTETAANAEMRVARPEVPLSLPPTHASWSRPGEAPDSLFTEQHDTEDGEMALARHQVQRLSDYVYNGNGPEETLQVAQTSHITSTNEASEFEWQQGAEVSLEDESKKFRDIEKQFKSLENPSPEQRVLFAKHEMEEKSRQEVMRARDISKIAQSERDQETSGDCSAENEDDSAPVTIEEPKTPAARPKRNSSSKKPKGIQISEKQRKIAMEVGLREMIGVNDLTKELYPQKKVRSGNRDGALSTPKKSKSRKKTTRMTEEDLMSIAGSSSDMIASAQLSASMPAIPTSALKDKQKALRETVRMIAGIPTADLEKARSDKQNILAATQKFSRGVKADGGKWAVPGLRTSLFHYQVLGTGWMRERERSDDAPRGGLLCDFMGLGKTLTALTSILDGRQMDPSVKEAPTLVVVPSHLVEHWFQEINRHFDWARIDNSRDFPSGCVVDEHKGPPKAGFHHEMLAMERKHIVITTYHEVSKSYPSMKIPEELKPGSNEEIKRWWIEGYKEKAGLLHQINWHRIILDEGHCIRNERSITSIAVRALSGEFRWILTGTPLHNGIKDFFAYFNFLKERHSSTFEGFESEFYNGDEDSQGRLLNTLRAILMRRTHASRLFGLPIISLPNITEGNVEVELCQAERLLYDEIVDLWLEKVNELSAPRNKLRQGQCVLAMYNHLRMFASHILTAQDLVQYILKENVLAALEPLEANEGSSEDLSSQISRLLRLVKTQAPIPKAPAQVRDESSRRQSPHNRQKLIQAFEELLRTLDGNEPTERQQCAACQDFPIHPFITSCKHLYCEECFDELDMEAEHRVCCICHSKIEESAYYGALNSINRYLDQNADSLSSQSKTKGRQRQAGQKAANFGMKRRKTGSYSKALNLLCRDARYEDGNESSPEDEEPEDWIPIIGLDMPAAKLSKIREMIHTWIREDPAVKILVFTHFLDSVRLLEFMCTKESWSYTTMHGGLPMRVRSKNIAQFQEDACLRIMIATVKTGGTGVDLTAANKCILMDLWWNDAVQQQAYFRVFRLTQARNVECVKVIAKDTVDEKMLELQQLKSEEIESIMSLKALEGRDTIKRLLELFGEVHEAKGGGFKVIRDRKQKGQQAPADSAE